MPKKSPEPILEKQNDTMSADRAIELGSQEFRTSWIGGQLITTELARHFGLQPHHPGNKQFLAVLTLRLMRRARAIYTETPYAPD